MVTIGINYPDMSKITIKKPKNWDYRTEDNYYMLMKKLTPNIIIQIVSSNNGIYGMTNRVEVKRLVTQPFYSNISDLSISQIINMTLNIELIDVMDNPYRESIQRFIGDTIKKYNG